MILKVAKQGGVATVVLAGALWLAATAAGQQPAANPHDGEWFLEFRVFTRPGGETLTFPNDTQQVNLLFCVTRESFTVEADGSLRWEQRQGGSLHWDDYSATVGKTWVQNQQPVLRAIGQATATLAAPGSGRTYDRRLTLELAWTGGSGRGIDHSGQPFVTTLSADGSRWTTSGYTRAAPYSKSQWELTPASVRREEIAPDTIRETTTYRATRRIALADFMAPGPSIPVTEQIEIKHVRYPQLVPRG